MAAPAPNGFIIAQQGSAEPLLPGAAPVAVQLISAQALVVVHNLTIVGIPAASTELGTGGQYRVPFPLADPVSGQASATEVRLRAWITTGANVGNPIATLSMPTNNNGVTPFVTLGSTVPLDTHGIANGAWTEIPLAQRHPNAFFRITTSGGNGAQNPVVSFFIEVR